MYRLHTPLIWGNLKGARQKTCEFHSYSLVLVFRHLHEYFKIDSALKPNDNKHFETDLHLIMSIPSPSRTF